MNNLNPRKVKLTRAKWIVKTNRDGIFGFLRKGDAKAFAKGYRSGTRNGKHGKAKVLKRKLKSYKDK